MTPHKTLLSLICFFIFLLPACQKTPPQTVAPPTRETSPAKSTSGISEDSKPQNTEPHIGPDIYTEATILADTDNRGINLVKKLTGISQDVEVEKSGWVDLDGDKEYHEFFALFLVRGIGDDAETYHHLAIVKEGEYFDELIYHEVRDHVGYDIVFFQRNEKPQMMYYCIQGSALWLSFAIFEYAPHGMFTTFNKLYEYTIGSYGDYYFLDKKLLFTGNGGKYNLTFVDGTYQLDDYDGRGGATAPNELSFVYEHETDVFKIFFNNEEIQFRKEIDREFNTDHIVNITPIKIKRNTLVLINDYLKPDQFDISIQRSHDTIEVIDGFYDVYKFTKKGLTDIAIRADDWYNVRFLVE